MIEKLEIKNIATFDENGIQIDDLKKINFIYGANGSGKTTPEFDT
jgi:AAA15 family ATPase/GTPase